MSEWMNDPVIEGRVSTDAGMSDVRITADRDTGHVEVLMPSRWVTAAEAVWIGRMIAEAACLAGPVVALIDDGADRWDRVDGRDLWQLNGAGHPWARSAIEEAYGPVTEVRGVRGA